VARSASAASSQSAAAARYAEGLFGIARAEGRLEAVRRELNDLVELHRSSPQLRLLLARPDVDADRKMAALRAGLGGELTQTLMGLVNSLVRHGRGGHLPAVAEEFGRLADAAGGVIRGEVRTAVPLTDEQRARLTAALVARAFGRRPTVLLTERLDAAVLAGAVVQLGDRLLDGSAAGRLARMREALIRGSGRDMPRPTTGSAGWQSAPQGGSG